MMVGRCRTCIVESPGSPLLTAPRNALNKSDGMWQSKPESTEGMTLQQQNG